MTVCFWNLDQRTGTDHVYRLYKLMYGPLIFLQKNVYKIGEFEAFWAKRASKIVWTWVLWLRTDAWPVPSLMVAQCLKQYRNASSTWYTLAKNMTFLWLSLSLKLWVTEEKCWRQDFSRNRCSLARHCFIAYFMIGIIMTLIVGCDNVFTHFGLVLANFSIHFYGIA